MKPNIISRLSTLTGEYSGEGVNHEKQPFRGRLALQPLLGGAGIQLSFRAIGEDGCNFHEEITTIAPDLEGEIGLYNLNTNMPGLVRHRLTQESTSPEGIERAIFAFGDRTDAQNFREEITIELHPNGGLGYRYAWGMPGGDFADRSGLVMRRA